MSDKTKAREILEQLEEDGLENRDAVLYAHHSALMALTGEGTNLEEPAHVKRSTPKKTPAEGTAPPTGPRPNDTRVARDERITPAVPPGQSKGSKDARLAEDSRIEDARNAVGGEEEATEREAEERKKIKADKKLSAQHGVSKGDKHPEDRGMDGATTKKAKKAR